MKKDKKMIQFKEDGPFALPQAGDGSGYAIVGLGSAGVNVVDHLYLENSAWKNIYAIDTDHQKIRGSVVPHKLLMGKNRLRGLGAGGDRELAEDLARLELPEFLRMLAGVRTVIFVAGLGGGTATGVLPVWVEELRQRGLRTLVLASTPFEFEGNRRRDLATGALLDLQREADVLLTFSNTRLLHLPESKEDIREVFRQMNALLGQACLGIQRLIEENSSAPLAVSELRELVREGGMENCWIGVGSAHGPDRIEEVVEHIMASPLLEDGLVWNRAESAILSVVAGADFTLGEYRSLVEQLKDRFPVDLPVRGNSSTDARLRDGLQVVVFFTGASGDVLEADMVADKAASVLADVPGLEPEEAGDFSDLEEPDRAEKEIPHVSLKNQETLFLLEAGDAERETQQRYFPRQEELPLDQRRQRGLFENTEPTLVDGEDLDIPTFMRLNMKIKV